MSLRWKAAALVAGAFLIYAALISTAQRLIVYPSFMALEQADVVRSVERCAGALDREVHHLGVMCADWAEWDDTYEFAEDHNEEYVESNLVYPLFEDSDLNLIYVVDESGTLVWGATYDLSSGERVALPAFSLDHFPADHPFMVHGSETSERSGLVRTDRGVLALAAHQILTSQGEGPVHGTLLMGRFVDSSMVAAIREVAREDVDVQPLLDGAEPERWGERLDGTALNVYVAESGDSALVATTTVADMAGQQALLVRVTVPRRIIAEGRRAQGVSAAFLILTGVGLLVLVLVLIERQIVARAAKVSAVMQRVAESGDLGQVVSVGGNDELTTLAAQANAMFAALRTAEESIRAREEQWRQFLEYVPVAIAVFDREAKYVIASGKWIEDSGLQGTDVVGRPYREVGTATTDRWEQILERCLAGSTKAADEELMRYSDGSQRWVRWAAYPWRDVSSAIGGMIVFAEDVGERKEIQERLDAQSRAMVEASTPVLKLWKGAILVPIVGTLDDERAMQMTEMMLRAIVEESAVAAVLDVTGISDLNTSVARHIISAVDAARILGTQVIITGFSPEAAQTLAQLGVDFSALRTRGSLGAGVEDALKLAGARISRSS